MKYYKYKYKNYWMIIISFITIFLMLFLSFIIPSEIFKEIYSLDIGIILVLVILLLIIHELIHGIGFRYIGKAKRDNIIYGAVLEKGVFYCACKEEINKKSIIISLILPFLVLTIMLSLIGFIFKIYFLVYLAFLNLLGASYDILATIDIIKLPKDIMYKDLDDPVGFILISNKDLNKYKYTILKIIESGEYNSKVVITNNNQKLIITNFSKIVFIILFILIIVEFMV